MTTPDTHNVIVLHPDGTVDPMEPAEPKAPLPQCKAHSRSGARCRNVPMAGTVVCRMHGGASPQVQRKARLRLLELVDPAIATLAREMTTAPLSADRQRAANSILDRAGVVRQNTPDTDTARTLLVARLLAATQEPS